MTIAAVDLTLHDLVPPEELGRLLAERYVTVRKHPTLDLWIYNYGPKCQYEPYWTEHTRLLRGLIVRGGGGAIVARPLSKFWNLGERIWDAVSGEPIPVVPPVIDAPFEVYEKMDGSLGIGFIDADGLPSLATRGSFVSEQARRGTEILRARYASALPKLAARLPDLTFCFEIIYPENRIVVDYADRADVVLLAVLDTRTGRDLPLADFDDLGFPVARTWACPDFEQIEELCESDELDGQEGFVVRFATGHRVKVKRTDYQHLHRLVTGVTPRKVWERLREGWTVDALVNGTPPGYAAWVRGIADGLTTRHADTIAHHAALLAERELPDRRAFAEYAKTAPMPALMFALYDGRPEKADEIVWKALRPEPAEPFRVET